jgi:AraC family transcriptional regulator, transcriptional activator FtrA
MVSMRTGSPAGRAPTSVRKDLSRYDPDMAHRVTVVAYEGIAPFELGVTAEVFALARPELEVDWWYDFSVCAERPGRLPAVGGFGLAVESGLEELERADTIVLPGTPDPYGDPSEELVGMLRRAHGRGARIMSICSGAFVLAATGLLDGRRAATHWRYADLLARRYPRVEVTPDVLYVDGEDLLTSAGTAAGIDLCLHLVRKDHGARVANRVARRMVVAAHRDGGQAQFIDLPVTAPPADDPVSRSMEWALSRLGERIGVEDLARNAHLSPRQFARRFRAATGASPGAWLLRRRLDAALPLLESSDQPVEQVAARVGFPTPAAFRRHFARAYGVPPSAWRKSFRVSLPTSGPGRLAK